MSKYKKIFTNWRVIVLFVFILFSFMVINPSLSEIEGAAVRSISPNSTFTFSGIESPDASTKPRDRAVITEFNGNKIENADQLNNLLEGVSVGDIVTYKLKDEGALRSVEVLPQYEIIEVEQEVTYEEEVNGTLVNSTRIELVNQSVATDVANLGLRVYDAPQSNIKKGLDLQGGTFALLAPEKDIDDEVLELSKQSYEQRLNAFGLSDLTVSTSSDLTGNKYIKVEVAGATDDEIVELLGSQGKFEAKIAGQTVFVGGKDITYVCTSPSCSGIDAHRGGCQNTGNGWYCPTSFRVDLTQDAANKFAEATRNLQVVDQQLSSPIEFYLDNQLASSLPISGSLKGVPATQVIITGGAAGADQISANDNAQQDMKSMQSVLQTGSLPVKYNIVSINPVSAKLGNEFFNNAVFVGAIAILAVCVVVYARYRQIKVVLPLLFTSLSEVLVLLGIYVWLGKQLDLAAIAGIIIAVGTGVDHQIVIIEEILSGASKAILTWKEKIKRAFAIISASYLTTVVAMVVLMMAGAGLLFGFAMTTIIGLTFGILITRPVFAFVVEQLLNKD